MRQDDARLRDEALPGFLHAGCKSPSGHNTWLTTGTAECNNSTTFPGIGLGAILCRARQVSPSLLVAATKALAAQAPALKDPNAGLLPDVTDVREISVQIAKAVIKTAVKEGLNEEKEIPEDDAELEEWIREQMWDARYRQLKRVEMHDATAMAKGEAGTASVKRGAVM